LWYSVDNIIQETSYSTDINGGNSVDKKTNLWVLTLDKNGSVALTQVGLS